MTVKFYLTCPICGRERVAAFDDGLFGERVPVPEAALRKPCEECETGALKTDWTRAVFEAKGTAWRRHFPSLHGTDSEMLDRALVLRDAEVRELEERLRDISITPDKREQIVNTFLYAHRDASWWIDADYPAADLLESLNA